MTLISIIFLVQVLTLPFVILRTVIQYYTTGTVLLRAHSEFANSLYKNVHMAIEYHFIDHFTRDDVAVFMYQPAKMYFSKYRNHPFAKGLRGFGDRINDRTYWVVKSNEPEHSKGKSALLFFHGGGFCVNMFATQFIGILGTYHSVPEPQKSKLLVALLDYSLTCHYANYPTQIFQAMEAYRELVRAGYTDITLIGDSAGGNLAGAISRFIAYPEEAMEQFSRYKEFNWDFSPVLQPANIIWISPWVEPYTKPKLIPGTNNWGDLGSSGGGLGTWYIEGSKEKDVEAFVNLNITNYKQHWSKVDAVNGKGRSLYIYGELEVLRHGMEVFVDLITKEGNGKLETYMEKGGIHDGLFYVESLDHMNNWGGQKALDSKFKGKYAHNLVGKFLGEVIG
ncbi:CIC11C00000000076 [Sungouiella intermedia]|uniref:CIC11C00000000076 n=1 Tax=Sungouiella intermedia TaxID=45354 RepID=A0A1L0BK02_9ASCO|nr:CIC11C00000000076 [[Candida] intermedia]